MAMKGERAYLAIDIGASKTLLAAFSLDGRLLKDFKFPTPESYKKFIPAVAEAVKEELSGYDFVVAACAVPGRIDRKAGIGETFGNLSWKNVPLKADLGRVLSLAVLIENDANLAGLSEAIYHKKYQTVLYLTLSTGIGDGVITDGKIDSTLADSEAGQMLLSHRGKLTTWEDFASGRALKARYGKLASEIESESIWREYAEDVAIGLKELLAVIQPDAVIIGGGVGAHLEKFKAPLMEELAKYNNDLVKIPPIIKARHAEQAVIYGCYEFIKQNA